ncbi:MAG TPA: GDP-mannose 4,6-dehydratase [Pseudoxanthomonas sp.]|nr:GDP-mannose 4,6-dehydratase [Pseudoxanthomonas sp.]
MASLSDMEQPIALVTGLNGFTGRYVAAELARFGYLVRGLEGDNPGCETVDLTDRLAVRAAIERLQPRVVVHLAAISFVAHGDAEAIYRVNIVGTRNLLEALAAQQTGPSHVILVSSANIYGNAGGLITEDVRPSPQNDYAVSKLAMEHMAGLWADHLPVIIVRPFNYIGIGQSEKFLIPKIVAHFRRKAAVVELGNLDIWRDFYDVRYIASIYRRLLDVESNFDVYNICSGEEHSLRQIIAMMEEIAGHSIEVRVNPQFIRANEVTRLRGDATRLALRIGKLPSFSLRDTLHWMYDA